MPAENLVPPPAAPTTDITQITGQPPPAPGNPSPPSVEAQFAAHLARKGAAGQAAPATPSAPAGSTPSPVPPAPGAGAAQPGEPGAQGTPPEPSAKPPKAPAPPAADDDREDADLQLSRALQTVQQRDRELTTLRAQIKDATKAATTLRELQARAKSPEDVLDVIQELTGYSFVDLAKAINEEVVKPPKGARYANLPPEAVQRIEELEKEVKAGKETREREAFQAQFRQDTEAVAGYLKKNADDFPILNALELAPAVVQSAYQQQKLNEGVRIAVDLEQRQRATFERLLSNDAALEAVIGSNDTLRAKLAAKFGGQPPVVSNGHGGEAGNGAPPQVSRSSEQPLVGPDTRTDAEREAYAVAELAKRMAAKNAQH